MRFSSYTHTHPCLYRFLLANVFFLIVTVNISEINRSIRHGCCQRAETVCCLQLFMEIFLVWFYGQSNIKQKPSGPWDFTLGLKVVSKHLSFRISVTRLFQVTVSVSTPQAQSHSAHGFTSSISAESQHYTTDANALWRLNSSAGVILCIHCRL